MSCVFARCFKISIGLLLGCAIFVGYSAMNALGVVERNNRIPTTANFLNRGDRLSIVSASKPRANILSPGTMRSSAKRPPLGCDPMFSPIADPAHARLYRRCEA